MRARVDFPEPDSPAIASVVAGWDARNVVEKLELQIGADLQYIRINGTIVGGLVGVLIYTLSGLFGART